MIKLRTAQKLFLQKAEQSRKEGHTKGLLIFATGLGKSLAALSDALRVAGDKGKILVLAQNYNLLEQHAKDFKKLNKTRKIGFMYKVKKDFNANVIFGNVKTIKNYLKNFNKKEFDYIIVDESHHSSADTYIPILNYFTPKFLLGMTATPERNDEKDIFPLYNNNILLEVGEKEAKQKGWLRDYKVIALWDKWCNYEELKKYRNKEGLYKYNINEVGKRYFIPERMKGIFDVLKNGKEGMNFKGIGNKKGIYFCVRRPIAKKYCEEFNKWGIKSTYIDGETNPKKREEILKDFEDGKYQLLFNVNLIGEGFHIPEVDVVIIDRPTDSHILWNQQKGRQLFNVEGQENYTKGLLIDFVGNSKGNFKHYTYNSKQKKSNSKKEMLKLIELSIGVKCEFQEEVIEHLTHESSIMYNSLEDAIREYKNYYGNKKPTIGQLHKEHRWIYIHFFKHGLVEKYCKKSQMIKTNRGTLEDAIREFKIIYGNEKPFRNQLYKEHQWIYGHLRKHELVNKYCKKSKQRTLEDAIREFKRIYGNKKPLQFKLRKEHYWICGHLRKHGLLSEYCQFIQRMTLQDAIREFKRIYGKNKPSKIQLRKENPKINERLYKNNLLNKYCKKSAQRTLEDAIREFKRIYGNKKPFRSQLCKEHYWIYGNFRKHELVNKYCKRTRTKNSKKMNLK